jgi:lysozyme family protein
MGTDIGTIIEAVMKAEGGEAVTNDPNDGGGRTQFGISERANPEAWADGQVTHDEAAAIYFKKYVEAPGFHLIQPTSLQHLLVDFGVNSGTFIATQKLQTVLGVETDGHLGPQTLSALSQKDPVWVQNHLVAERIKLLCNLCVKRPNQLTYLNGWIRRALEFLL